MVSKYREIMELALKNPKAKEPVTKALYLSTVRLGLKGYQRTSLTFEAKASTSEVSDVKTSTAEEDFFEELTKTLTDSLTNLMPEDELRMPRLRMNLHWVYPTSNLEEPSDRPKGKQQRL
ncbi:Hypothetical predicted protein [Prunus dulcis]|uniref:Uncharacterized protein n=1 Tax=Prunus dulcis TaxID=3755 RepID=A0A5E4G4N9_PRUDU|nr:hypothetical protein L3X38_000044 [Prunus dulcis]VVA34729.1 Hypothetical predicted protein [Prunus dulcis]